MTTVSELAAALLGNEWDESTAKPRKRNFTDLDRQAAGSIGIKLGNNTRDHRVLKLLSDVHEHVQGPFRQDFEAALEQELSCLQETGLTTEQFDTALTYAKKLINSGMRSRMGPVEIRGLRTPYQLLGAPSVAGREDSHMEIHVNMHGLVGLKQYNPRRGSYTTVPGSSDDAKKVARTFQPMLTVDLKPSVDLQARRLDRPSITELHTPVRLPGNSVIFHAYEVGMGYVVRIPIGMFRTLYEQSQKNSG